MNHGPESIEITVLALCMGNPPAGALSFLWLFGPGGLGVRVKRVHSIDLSIRLNCYALCGQA